jgi:hypothetical protein
MKNSFFVWTCGILFSFCCISHAKPSKDGKSKSTYGCARFDVDQNGVLDEKEKAALLAAFNSGDVVLKTLDTNNNGKLDEAEIAAIRLDSPKKDNEKKRK